MRGEAILITMTEIASSVSDLLAMTLTLLVGLRPTNKRPSLSLRGALSVTWQSPTLKEEIATLRCAEFTLLLTGY
jgi:hypothetical protein